MITLDMVKRAYEAGIIKVEASVSKGISCEVRDMNLCLSTYLPFDDFMNWNAEHIAEKVFNYLQNEVETKDYLYIKKVLDEGLKELPVEILQDSTAATGAHVQLSLSDGTKFAESFFVSSLKNLEHACELISKINEGTYKNGQAPLRFDCVTSPELACDMRDLVVAFGKLVEAVGMDTKALAAQIVQGSPSLAGDIYRLVDKDYYKEDIVGKLEDKGIDVESLADEEISKMAERFENILSHNDGYWESYWLSAESAIDEVMKERAKCEDENALAWKTSDEMVDLALKDFKGFHDGQSSGLYGLGDFMVDGERMELVVEIYQYMDESEHRPYYGVYYWVGYYDDDSLFADWEYTSSLDVSELKKTISDLESRDFTEDIRKCMVKGSVETLVGDAQRRCVDAGTGENKAPEHVKE